MSVDDLLYASVNPEIRVGSVLIADGRRMTIVATGEIDSDYLTCEWFDCDGCSQRQNYWNQR